MKRVTTILAAMGAVAVLASALPAFADEAYRDQTWRGPLWQDQTRLAYPAYLPGYAYQPSYQPPPTVVDAPPPAFSAPTVVFTSPGVTIGID